VLKNDTDMTELPKNAVFDDVTVQLRQKTTQFCETPSVDISAFYGDEMLKSTQFENTDFSDDFKKEKKTKEKKKKETKEVPPTPPSRKKINKEKNKEEKNKEEENIYIYTKENFQKNCTEKRTAEHRENCDDKLWQWLQRCAPYIADNFEHLMTTEEKDYLASRYSQQLVTDTILAIENRRDKRQNYTNLYTTLLEWLPKMNMRYD
jgi:signal recognition particle GTPase